MNRTIGLLGAVLLLLLSNGANAGAVVVAKKSPAAPLQAEDAKKLFLGREPALSGQAVVLVYQKDSPATTDFDSKVLGKDASELKSYWSRLIFTGKAKWPLEANGDDDVKSRVNATPGAIGYISDASADDSVKVLLKY